MDPNSGSDPADAGPPEDDGAGSPPDPSFFHRLLQRAQGALGSPDVDPDDPNAELITGFASCTPTERTMIVNIMRLSDIRVEDVMTPRADITAVAADAALADVMARFQQGSLSRLPVYRETLDDPVGFVHLKDLALSYGVGCAGPPGPFDLAEHIRPALFVPPSMRIAALLQRMQGARVHMALVIDEFGGVDGLVTIEDLVEQIVGQIEDEHDEEELAHWREEHPGVYLLNARADIEAFEEAEGVRLETEGWDEEAETMGGLVFSLANRVPTRGEVIVHPDGHEFEVIEADPRRIKRLRLTLEGAGASLEAGPRKAAE